MQGHIEWVLVCGAQKAGVLRIGGAYGEDYDWCATVLVTGTHVEVMGVCKTVTAPIWRAVFATCAAAGCTTLGFVRRTHGAVRRRLWRLKAT